MNSIIRAKGGSKERVVAVQDIKIPDLWKLVHNHEVDLTARQKKEILECWHLCYDLLRAIKEQP